MSLRLADVVGILSLEKAESIASLFDLRTRAG